MVSQAELFKSEEFARTVLEASLNGIYVYDTSAGRNLYINPQYTAITGYTLEDFNAMDTETFLECFHPEDRPRVIAHMAEVLRSDSAGREIEYRFRTRDGRWIWCLSRDKAFGDLQKGPAPWFIGSFLDITERKQSRMALEESEFLYRELVQKANSAIIRWRRDGKIIFFNDYAQRIFGYRLEEVIGKSIGIIVPPRDSAGADLSELVEDILKSPYHFINNINENICRDGRRLWMVWTNRAILDTSGEVAEILAIGTDITELQTSNKSLEQEVAERTQIADVRTKQLQALTVELIEAEEAERRRISQLLHDDLQQMLASANLQLETAAVRLPADAILDNVGRILKASISKARRLSHELSPPVLKHTSLTASLEWLARMLKDQFQLEVQLALESTGMIDFQPLKVFIFRAAQELLFNIVKHAHVDRARVEFCHADGCVTLTITDNGRGFDPSCLDKSDTEKVGLGLRSLRERASYMGGSLSIESFRGQGSRFILTVPAKLDTAARRKRRITDVKPKRQTASGGQSEMSRLRVLFVDDHQMIRKAIINMMDNNPAIEVAGEAADGLEAIEQVKHLKPDVVVMDVSMPKMNGIDATRHITETFPNVRVVGLTMLEDDEIASQMQQAGAESVVCKTALSADLLKAIYGSAHQEAPSAVSKPPAA